MLSVSTDELKHMPGNRCGKIFVKKFSENSVSHVGSNPALRKISYGLVL